MKKKIFIASGLMLISIGVLCSCKGRTMSNMEPTGDTVEVQIGSAAPDAEPDSTVNI